MAVVVVWKRLGSLSHIFTAAGKKNEKDRMLLLNCLASYYINQLYSETDRRKRDELSNNATSMLNQCDRINSKDYLTIIHKGRVVERRNWPNPALFMTLYIRNVLPSHW